MTEFRPENVIIRENALNYPLGEKIYKIFSDREDTNLEVVAARGPFPFNYDLPFKKKFHRAKKTIVVAVRSINKFQTCKPSAHYQLPLISGCPAHCQYCYLSTNLGKNPYIKIYVNIKEILRKAGKYIEERAPETTIFEGAATSDPLPVEKWSGSLASAINFFAGTRPGRFRFVTKFTAVRPLLDLNHNRKTEIRFSLNSKYILKKFEPDTPELNERIKAAGKVFSAGYRTGFLLAPIFVYEGWKGDYKTVIKNIKETFSTADNNITFELISHRFTERARKIIKQAYPETDLPMDKEKRQFKYGQFGYGKYVYPENIRREMEQYLRKQIKKYLPGSEIKYFV